MAAALAPHFFFWEIKAQGRLLWIFGGIKLLSSGSNEVGLGGSVSSLSLNVRRWWVLIMRLSRALDVAASSPALLIIVCCLDYIIFLCLLSITYVIYYSLIVCDACLLVFFDVSYFLWSSSQSTDIQIRFRYISKAKMSIRTQVTTLIPKFCNSLLKFIVNVLFPCFHHVFIMVSYYRSRYHTEVLTHSCLD